MNRLEYFRKYTQESCSIRKLFEVSGSVTPLSSGVNDFPIPALYSKFGLKELEIPQFLTNYTRSSGNPVLREAISIYEKCFAYGNMTFPAGFADNICVTVGATSALMFYFEYYAQKYPNSTVLLIGLNYYAFFEYCTLNGLNKIILTSKMKNRVAPSLEEIIREIKTKRPKLLVLTLPLNPSGEIYTEEELRRLIGVLKENDMLFLFDKVQTDVFATNFDFININKIIVEEQYADNTIIIDGISKTRSLPGARIGYIIADKETIDYITYLNKVYYYNTPQLYIIPLIIDLMFRIIRFLFSTTGNGEVRFILKLFRRLTQSFFTPHENADIKNVFILSTYTREYKQFCQELENNYLTISKNYIYLLTRLKEFIHEKTSLKGGYNFCIKLSNVKASNQIQFCLDVFEKERIVLLPEFFFNDYQIDKKNDLFWIRITCAQPEETFIKTLDRLYDCLKILLK